MKNTHRMCLDGDWSLIYVENKRLRNEKPELMTIEQLEQIGYKKIPAKVPGNFERDLFRAGEIADPYKYAGTLPLMSYEKMHMFYYRSFTCDASDGEMSIVFGGIDTYSEIILNGEYLGKTENMLTEQIFDVTGKLRHGENELIVHIKPTMIAARDFPLAPGSSGSGVRAAALSTRKAPHMYGWDIMPRLISGGIWRSVFIEKKKESRIDNVFIAATKTNAENKTAVLSVYVNTKMGEDDNRDYSLIVTGKCGDSTFRGEIRAMWHSGVFLDITVKDAKLWMPRNYGEPNIYEVKTELLFRGEPVDEMTTYTGLRTVSLLHTDTTAGSGNGEFVFKINGKKIFAMGTNWVPIDAMHSFDRERIPHILPMLSDLGCNIVRCWGGNVYECDEFYDYCDRNGIMVWQDFSMACALYPQDERMKQLIFDEASSVVKRLRNHPSIILWAGDNECDAAYFWGERFPYMSPKTNALTREVIPSALRINDPSRPYLPSSPYISDKVWEKGTRYIPSESHLWGSRDYFKGNFYKNATCRFASETGYHGCNSPDSLSRFISKDQLWHWAKRKRELAPGELWSRNGDVPKTDWMMHSACATDDGTDPAKYRIPMMANQVITLFGKEPDNLFDFAYQSQISQAEAKKYFIERFRVGKWKRTGIIWWNLIDGWPQVSDAVVDYYGIKKLAYHYIKRSQAPLCLIFDEPENNVLPLYAVNDLQEDKEVKFRVTDLTADKSAASGTVTAKADSVTPVLQIETDCEKKHFYLIEWECGSETGKNHFFTNIIDIDYSEYISCMKKAGFYEEFEGFGSAHPVRSKILPYAFEKQR